MRSVTLRVFLAGLIASALAVGFARSAAAVPPGGFALVVEPRSAELEAGQMQTFSAWICPTDTSGMPNVGADGVPGTMDDSCSPADGAGWFVSGSIGSVSPPSGATTTLTGALPPGSTIETGAVIAMLDSLSDAADVTVRAAPDEDGDGVPDGQDACGGTRPGDPVDSSGCSDEQVDEDGDGVCNPGAPSGGPSGCTGTDNCPNDPNRDQRDSDGNGTGDACEPRVPAGEARVADPNTKFHRLYVTGPGVGDPEEKAEEEESFRDDRDDVRDALGRADNQDPIGSTSNELDKPTRKEFFDALDELKDLAQPGDEVTLVFITHGAREGISNPTRRAAEPDGMSESLSLNEKEALFDTELPGRLEGFRDGVTLVILLDVCWGGGFADGQHDVQESRDRAVIGPSGKCPVDEGFFTDTIAEDAASGVRQGFSGGKRADANGDGVVTADELKEFLRGEGWDIGDPTGTNECKSGKSKGGSNCIAPMISSAGDGFQAAALDISGQRFAPGSNVTMRLTFGSDSISDSIVLGSAATDGAGAFRTTVLIPAGAPAGDYHLFVDDPAGNDDWHQFVLRSSGDMDGDGAANPSDNCPTVANPDQADANRDGHGDACVSPGANILSGARLGFGVVVGDRAQIQHGAFVGDFGVIGAGTRLAKDVFVGRRAVLGTNLLIDKNVGMGMDVTIGDRGHVKMGANLGNDVTIGSNVSVGQFTQIDDGASVGSDVWIGRDVRIGPRVVIGDDVVIRNRAVIRYHTTIPDGATIGPNSSIGSDVTIGTDAAIGSDVTIGDGATIGDGVTIPDGATIPAGATVP